MSQRLRDTLTYAHHIDDTLKERRRGAQGDAEHADTITWDDNVVDMVVSDVRRLALHIAYAHALSTADTYDKWVRTPQAITYLSVAAKRSSK